jgi:intracellular multiplication protein IcmS
MTDKKAKASDKVSEKIVGQIASIAEALECHFTLKGDPISIDQVFSKNGLLPAIMRRADQLCSFCLGYGLGLTFEKADSAMLGVSVDFDEATPTALRLLCAADVLIEIMQSAPSQDVTPLDELMLD